MSYNDFDFIKFSYIRGYIKNNNIKISNEILNKEIFNLTDDEKELLLSIANDKELKLYYFKEKSYLPRVNIVLGFLKGIQPQTLLDIGSGRGVFLFPLLKEISMLDITSMEINPKRLELLKNIENGGINNLHVLNQDITKATFENKYDVVTMLEVLEHIPDVEKAIFNAINLAKKFIIITVPSKKDDNPEHIHLLTKDILTKIFNSYGIYNLSFGGVNGHLSLIVKLNEEVK